MMFDKIMARQNLDDIILRLDCCAALLWMIHANMGEECGRDGLCDALAGACYLLETVTRDFLADIGSSEDYMGKEDDDL